MSDIEKQLRAGEVIKLSDNLTIWMFTIDDTNFCTVEYSNSRNGMKWLDSGYISKFIKEVNQYRKLDEVTQ